jgi:photosystem II stability/assembly factor-like uncharacterized protein
MDVATGMAAVRVAASVTHRPVNCRHGRPIVAALVVLLAAIVAGPVAGQEEPAPEPAIMAPLAPRSLLLDAATAGGRLVVVGERGHILVSDDNGDTWRQVPAPIRTMLTGVTFIDDVLGFAVGHDSVILRSRDAGDSWELVYRAPEDEAPLFDVWFSDADNGIAVGAYGSFFRTADGGDSWLFEPIGDTDWHLHKIADAGGGRLYLAAEAGVAYRSDDGGLSWTELPSPYEGSFFGVLPLGGDTVLLYGLRGHLFRSEDAGESWSQIDTGTVALLSAGVRLSDGTVVVAGLGGTILVSSDDGRSFSRYQQPGRRGIADIIETGNGGLLMVGEFGVRSITLNQLTTVAE